MSQSSDPLHDKDPAVPDLPELDPLERLSRGLTQWERELLAQPRSPSRPRASTDLERVNHVLQASRQVSGTLDLNELLVRIVDSVVQIAGSDRGFLMLMREDGKLHFEIARSRDQSTLPPEEFQVSWSVAEEAAHRRETAWVPDAIGSSLFQDRKSVRELSLRTVVALPILNSGRVLGVLYVDSHSIAHEFTPEDIAILEGFAAQVAVALENARLHEQLKDSKNRLEIENLNLRRALKEESRYGLLVGRSPKMLRTLQVKLIRVLQDSQIRRVGDTVSRRVDFRLVTATNRDLKAEVDAGRFRQDLFYRLNVVPITLPPLRERGEDVLLLAQHFLEFFAKQQTKEIRGLTSESRELLLRHPWLGNVRELENAMARAVALSDNGAMIEPALFGLGPPVTRRWDGQHTLRETLDAVEAETIREALRQCDSN